MECAPWMMVALMLPRLWQQRRMQECLSPFARGTAHASRRPSSRPALSQGLMWMPGYWAYDYDAQSYYWVPGAWVPAPFQGAL